MFPDGAAEPADGRGERRQSFRVRAAIGRPIIYIFFFLFAVFLFLPPFFAAFFLPFFAALRFLAIDITSFLDKILQHHSDLSKRFFKLCATITFESRRATVGTRMMHASFWERCGPGANLRCRRMGVRTSRSGCTKGRGAANSDRFIGLVLCVAYVVMFDESPVVIR